MDTIFHTESLKNISLEVDSFQESKAV